MPIITIFGGTFGDDEELARNVATKLGCQFVSREIFVAASQRCDVPEAKLSDIVEKEPHWWNVGMKICGLTRSRCRRP
jgi:hypothetical protein